MELGCNLCDTQICVWCPYHCVRHAFPGSNLFGTRSEAKWKHSQTDPLVWFVLPVLVQVWLVQFSHSPSSIGTFHFPVCQKLGGSLGGMVTEWDEHCESKILIILHYLFSSSTTADPYKNCHFTTRPSRARELDPAGPDPGLRQDYQRAIWFLNRPGSQISFLGRLWSRVLAT